MDKNTLVGFALIGAVIVGFGIYNRPSQKEMARAQHYQDSIQAVAQKQEQMQKAQEIAASLPVVPDSTSLFFPSIVKVLKSLLRVVCESESHGRR